MKALVIAPQPFFTPRGTPFSVYYRTMVTARLGVEVDLLTYGEGQDVEIPGVRIIRGPKFPFLGPVKIGPSPLKLFLDIFIVLQTLWLLMRNRYDFVHAHEEAVFFCRFLKPIFGFKLVYDMHSSLPQQLTNFQFTTSKSLIGLFTWLEDSCLEAAEAVITICPDLRDQVLDTIDTPEKHFLIENSIFSPVKLVGAAADDEKPDRTDVPSAPAGRKSIVYAGTLESYQGIELLLTAFKTTLESEPSAHLLIIGGTPEQVDYFRGVARDVDVDSDCVFTGRVQPDVARAAAAAADLLVSPRIEGTNTPLKVYEQLASGIPLVATAIYSHTQVLNDQVCFLAEPEAQAFGQAMARALGHEHKHEEERERVVRGALECYERDYSETAYVGKMQRLFERLAQATQDN